MFRSVLVLSVLGCAFGQFFMKGDMEGTMKYRDMKVMESCVGTAAVEEMMGKMYAAVATCSATPSENEIQLDFSSMTEMAAELFPGDKMQQAQDKANAFAANMTCVLTQMKMLNADGTPNYENCLKWINSLEVSESLKAGFIEAHNDCQAFAECAPVDTVKCPITRRFGRIMAYKKCHCTKMSEVCMKEDFKKLFSGPEKMDLGIMEMMDTFEDVLSYGNVKKVLDM